MPKQLRLNEQLGLSPASAVRHFVTADELRSVMQDAGSLDVNIKVAETAQDSWKLTITRNFEAEWPSIFSNLIGKQLKIREVRTWSIANETHATGTMSMEVVGQPVTMHGTVTLDGRDSGSRVQIDAETRASIPFIGGIVEDFVVRYLADGIAHEIQEFNKFA